MDPVSAPAVEPLVRIWTALHAGFHPAVTATDAVYLQHVMLELDDDLLAQLLAVKLTSAMRLPFDDGTTVAVRTGSRVRFVVDGHATQAVLVHGRTDDAGVLGSASRYGAALLGLRPGDAILWPREDRRLIEVRVTEIASAESAVPRPAPLIVPAKGVPCASG